LASKTKSKRATHTHGWNGEKEKQAQAGWHAQIKERTIERRRRRKRENWHTRGNCSKRASKTERIKEYTQSQTFMYTYIDQEIMTR